MISYALSPLHFLVVLALHNSQGFQGASPVIASVGEGRGQSPIAPSKRATGSDGKAVSASDYENPIVVTSSIDLPFSSDVAYDAFSDLPRQPSWSPWLRRVCYVDEPDCQISQWTMRMAGLSFSWNSISTRKERPRVIEWESTSGIRNKGRVDIRPMARDGSCVDAEVANESTHKYCQMTLTMTFEAPRIVAALFRHDFSAIRAQMEERILRRTLVNFREVVLRHDLHETQALQELILRESGILFPN